MAWAGLAGSGLLLLLLLSAGVLAESLDFGSSWPFKTDRCQYDSRERCNAASGGRVCGWCDLPQGCYPLDRLDELGYFCDRVKIKVPPEDFECESVATKEDCLALDPCHWCTSTAVHDACFGLMEARRLPFQERCCANVSYTSADHMRCSTCS